MVMRTDPAATGTITITDRSMVSRPVPTRRLELAARCA